MKNINPENYNLSQRIILKQNELGELFLVIDRKSRIIMKDGKRILEMVHKIKSFDKGIKVSVLTSAPVCSKSRSYLKEKNIIIKTLS